MRKGARHWVVSGSAQEVVAEGAKAMMLYGTCKQCQGQMAILDILLEGYDLICTRCGQREIINRGLTQPPPCYQ